MTGIGEQVEQLCGRSHHVAVCDTFEYSFDVLGALVGVQEINRHGSLES